MPPDAQRPGGGEKRRDSAGTSGQASGSSQQPHKERIGNYAVLNEIGRGSFATVYKGYRSKTREPVAIKAVSRQKLTTKLLENLESEINILKAISHRNIVALQDCFKNDTHIYLVMEYCTGSDLSFYIKNRGKLSTLDFIPRPGMFTDRDPPSSIAEKIYWPHPLSGGIDERVTRCFLGQLAHALQFLRSQDLIHRDIKPQNLLLQPASGVEVSEGHPLGIPILKVADFGFARILPAAAMAETLCGSPLYMAPEILRYEKYDAKADLWSVGAVLFEMAVGRPPFRASNHVELLRKIEKGEDRIKFPDESSHRHDPPAEGKEALPPPIPVSTDIKALIRTLLKRKPQERMSFEDFFASGVWDGYMHERIESSDGSISFDTSTDEGSSILGGSATAAQVRELVKSQERIREASQPVSPPAHRAPQPISADPALNPRPAPPARILTDSRPPFAVMPAQTRVSPVQRRSEPRYYVDGGEPSSPNPTANAGPSVVPTSTSPATTAPASTSPSNRAGPRPIISSAQRRMSARDKEPSSIDDPPPVTPNSANTGLMYRPNRVEGSPLAATPPLTMPIDDTGKDETSLDGSDSVVNREYVVVEKQNVQVNALADELDQAARANQALVRRPSSRTSVVSRPVSAFRPATTATTVPGSSPSAERTAVVPAAYSPPPFGLSTTPPFAVQRQTSRTSISRTPSIPQALNVFPPPSIPGFSPDTIRYGTSPSSLQTGALARALTNTAIRLIGSGANTAATAIARATARRRPSILRGTSGTEMDPAEDELIRTVEDLARKAFVLFELGDQRLHTWHSLVRPPGLVGAGTGTTPPYGNTSAASPRRKSSSSSFNSEVIALRAQQEAAGEATVLYCKALAFIVAGTNQCQRYWEGKGQEYDASPELNDLVQWLRARFNECYEKAEWAKARAAEELPFIDRLLHDKARDSSRQAALAELSGDWSAAEAGYETSLWQLQTLLDDIMYDGGHIREDDKISVEKVMTPIKTRLEALRRKMADGGNTVTG